MSGNTKKFGNAVLRLVFPFSAMKSTAMLAKREVERSRENAQFIRDLFKTVVRRAETPAPTADDVPAEPGFEEFMANRPALALSIEELDRFFLSRKRSALSFGALFLGGSILGLAGGLNAGDLKTFLLSLSSGCVATALFFLMSLSAEHRRWQLRERRLSRAERGGVKDFCQETHCWPLVVLDPRARAAKELRDDR